MDDLQARKNALLAQLATADEPPPLLHPSMGDLYRSKAEELTSGANNVTGATTRALELLFGDKYDFVVTSLMAGTTPIRTTASPKWQMMSWTCAYIRAFPPSGRSRTKAGQAIRRLGGQSHAEAD